MTDTVEVVSGVHVHTYDLDADFACGSLENLARGLRDALWSDLNLYAATDTLIVRVGGDRPESQDRALEVACDCDEYCDEDHGEGRIDLHVFKPSFHELAASRAETDGENRV
jgi:hypothetical protein